MVGVVNGLRGEGERSVTPSTRPWNLPTCRCGSAGATEPRIVTQDAAGAVARSAGADGPAGRACGRHRSGPSEGRPSKASAVGVVNAVAGGAAPPHDTPGIRRMTAEMSVASAGIACDGAFPRTRVPPRPPAVAGGYGAAPGRGAAAGGRPRRRPPAGAGGPRHRQDDHDRGRCGGPDRAAGYRPRARARPDLQPQGRGRAPRAHHRAAAPHHPRAAGHDLPQLRLCTGPPGVRARGRRAAAAAFRARAAARGAPDAARRGPGRRGPLAGPAPPGPGHQGLRRGGARPVATRRGARPGRPGAAPAWACSAAATTG